MFYRRPLEHTTMMRFASSSCRLSHDIWPSLHISRCSHKSNTTWAQTSGLHFCCFVLFLSRLRAMAVQTDLTATEVLQEVGEALDDAGVLGTIPAGVTDKDFGAGPRALAVQHRALIGRVAALLVQLAVDILWKKQKQIDFLFTETENFTVSTCFWVPSPCCFLRHMTVKRVAKADMMTSGTVMAMARIGPAHGEWTGVENNMRKTTVLLIGC